ncbi:hypothetical protein [Glacieibacterium frigidum]|uniref:Uncharacterized protein n=1 Tax=Glacieibacterium frigidum TaxID=2593303 RepID=A0A552UF36_9SPHN|nr:hypothetical protein [Glacieibacterium frigidum]TRW16836.1 hypothetical protein FMM06_01105 [Glacieibacterium frigidum]
MSETPSQKRRRLRWLTLAEVIGIGGLALAAAGYWDSHRERAVAEAPAPAKPLLLAATATDGDLTLRPARGEATVQTQTLIFPATIRADSVETTGNARVEAAWVMEGLRKAVDDDTVKPPRLPVGIVTTFEDGGTVRSDAAIYDVGYAFRDRVLRGRAVELEGITLVRRMPAQGLKAAVEARWAKVVPAKE